MSVNILAVENNFWTEVKKGSVIIWYKGFFHNYSLATIISKCVNTDSTEIGSFIKSIDGHFAIIVQRCDLTFMAVDKIRSTPLYYSKAQDSFFIDYNPKNLINKNFDRTINENSKLEISMSGYTIGSKTIYQNLYSLKAGELIFFSNGIVRSLKYHKYFSDINKKSFEDFKYELSELTLNIFKKTIKSIGDRQVVIPLSAGNDSRLVASIFKHLGLKNVLCFTYGIKDNFEANISKEIAQKLNYKWIFVDLNDHLTSSVFNTSRISEYFNYYETFNSCPCIQGLLSLEYLKSNNLIDKDAIFINGNSGDFISGGHINGLSFDSSSDPSYEERKEKILNKLVDKHFSLWGNLKSKKNIQIIKHNLWLELISDLGDLDPYSKEKDHLYYEYSEFVGRQSKYVISCQKAFEFYGHEWRIPLWDDQFLDFFVKVPLEFKLNQKLYKEMLFKNNWGGVWTDDIPVNNKTIRPKWVFYCRFLLKPFFLIFGRKSKAFWKIFDRSFFYYWMDISRMIRIVNFSKFLTSIFKRPRHHVSFLSKNYLKNFN